jgi:hypothetical protein
MTEIYFRLKFEQPVIAEEACGLYLKLKQPEIDQSSMSGSQPQSAGSFQNGFRGWSIKV